MWFVSQRRRRRVTVLGHALCVSSHLLSDPVVGGPSSSGSWPSVHRSPVSTSRDPGRDLSPWTKRQRVGGWLGSPVKRPPPPFTYREVSVLWTCPTVLRSWGCVDVLESDRAVDREEVGNWSRLGGGGPRRVSEGSWSPPRSRPARTLFGWVLSLSRTQSRLPGTVVLERGPVTPRRGLGLWRLRLVVGRRAGRYPVPVERPWKIVRRGTQSLSSRRRPFVVGDVPSPFLWFVHRVTVGPARDVTRRRRRNTEMSSLDHRTSKETGLTTTLRLKFLTLWGRSLLGPTS